MDAERPAALRDAHQAVDEVGQLVGKSRELVDDDHQPRQVLIPGVGAAWRLPDVRRDVGDAGVPQHPFASPQLGVQGTQCTRGQVTVEVGDQAHRVRQQCALPEGRTALVVDQDEDELVRSVHGGERGDEGLEELGLPGSGGAGDQDVRAVSRQVDDDRVTTGAHSDRHPGASPPACPRGGERPRVARVDVEQVEQPDVGRQSVVPAVRCRVPQRREGAREVHRPGQADAVEHDVVRGRPVDAVHPHLGARRVGELHRRGALDRERRDRRVAADDEDAGSGPLGEQPGTSSGRAERRPAERQHDSASRPGHLRVIMPIELGDQLVDQDLHLGVGGRDARARQLSTRRWLDVRQPAGPRPTRVVGEDDEAHVSRAVQAGHLCHEGPREPVARRRRPCDTEDTGRGKRHGDRDVGQLPRLGITWRVGTHLQAGGRRAEPDPQGQELLVGRLSSPQPRSVPSGRQEQLGEIRVGCVAPPVLAAQRRRHLELCPGDVAFVRGPVAASLTTRGDPIAEPGAQQHERRQDDEEQVRRGAGGDGQRDADQQRHCEGGHRWSGR